MTSTRRQPGESVVMDGGYLEGTGFFDSRRLPGPNDYRAAGAAAAARWSHERDRAVAREPYEEVARRMSFMPRHIRRERGFE